MSTAVAPSRPTRDCILVLGMHRSGTSALAGSLSAMGCATPASLIRGDENNEKGYFESNLIGRLSDRILDELGSAWNDWVPLRVDELPRDQLRDFQEQAQKIIADDFADAPLFVLKEPRMCRMVPFWLKVLSESGCTLHAIHTHRNPQEVAASLARRDGFDPAFSMLLWLRHVLDAEFATRGVPRVFTSYRHLMQDWRALAGTVTDRLGIRLDVETAEQTKAVGGFLSKQLQHFSDKAAETLSDPALPQNLRETFAIMEGWADTGEQVEDHPRLDALRQELDILSLAFGPLVRPGQMAMLAVAESAARIEALQEELGGREQALEDLSRKMEAVCAERDAKQAELLRLQGDIQARDSSLGALARAIENLRTDRV